MESSSLIKSLVETEEFEQVANVLDELSPDEKTRLIARLSKSNQQELLAGLDPEHAAEVVHGLPDIQSVELIQSLPPETSVPILTELPSDERADIVGDLSQENAEAIYREMPVRSSAQLRELVQYDDDVAGGLMTTEFLAFRDDDSVNSVVSNLRKNADQYSDFQVQYAYVVNHENRLVGVLRLRDVLLAEKNPALREIMIDTPVSVSDASTLVELKQFFDSHNYVGVPVTDPNQILVGVVDETAVEEAWAEKNADDFLKSKGIVQEELRTMPLLVRSRRRLAWLSINIVLNLLAASVIAAYQDTLAQVITLAVFLPIISDMSGCSGNQAVAVSMRELSLGVIRPEEVWFVWLKEISVGLINGLCLGILIALIGIIWQGNPWIGIVVGTAMMVNTMIAVSIGGILPLIIRLLKLDPALASGPILTTITDMCGFLIVLSLATLFLDRLV